MKDFNFVKYLLDKEEYAYLSDFEFCLTLYFYNYGNHFANRSRPKVSFKQYLKYLAAFVLGNINKYRDIGKSMHHYIISDSYFTINDELEKLGFKATRSPWSLDKKNPIAFDLDIQKRYKYLASACDSGMEVVLSKAFKDNYQTFYKNILDYIKKIDSPALFLPADATFYERILIKAFKQLNKPSFIYLHGGMPSSYDTYRYNLTDYLLVWGEKMKEEYVKGGFNSKKIIVVGHPYYKQVDAQRTLRFDFDDVLVMTKPVLGNPKKLEEKALQDRSNSFLYVYEIQYVLMKLGIKKARLRPHPSENKDWYLKNIDNSFYSLDHEDLKTSLSKATLVIGPTSTTFVEALYYGVNYVLYEPAINNIGMNYIPLTSPFGDNNNEIPTVTTTDELRVLIKSKKRVDPSVVGKYIKVPFDLGEVANIINKSY